MNMNDAIYLAAIGLMLYGIVQTVLTGDEFWFHPTGNLIGSIAVAVVISAMFGLSLDDELIVLVSVGLALFWFTRNKRNIKTPAQKRQTFEQVFTTVEVEPVAENVGKDEPEPETVVEYEVEPESEPVVESGSFIWNGA